MSALRLYNTRTRRKEIFVPGDPGRITMYVCGPTVYSRAHIGNARPAVVFDVLARLLRHLYGADALVYARNITDIDDKIMAAAVAEGVSTDEIAARFERHYVEDMGALGVAPPDLAPHATHHVPGMIALIGALIDRGVAYVADGHVLFSVAADPDYGSLSGRDRAAMLAGARVEVATYKRDGADFVLWKPSVAGQPRWESPWGFGRPGWHIECSAMIRELLGETVDIHGGGQDLIFPHHENEAAQSRCASGGAELARVWMHNGFLSMGADKMSKSLGNVVSVGELLEQGWDGEVLRLALLSAHYRQPLEWSQELLEQSKSRIDRWYRQLSSYADVALDEARSSLSGIFSNGESPAGYCNDLDLPWVVATVDAALSYWKSREDCDAKRSDLSMAASALRLMGLLTKTAERWFEPVLRPKPATFGLQGSPGELISEMEMRLHTLRDTRNAARAARDFATADRIRAELEAEGILLEDGPTGTTWRRA